MKIKITMIATKIAVFDSVISLSSPKLNDKVIAKTRMTYGQLLNFFLGVDFSSFFITHKYNSTNNLKCQKFIN